MRDAMKPWIDRANLRIFAIIEIRLSDGKCGIVMTGESRHALTIAMNRMIMRQKQRRYKFEVIELAERGVPHPLTKLKGPSI